ncbi:MAG TPA: PEP-CTERM sorting domain-containing protein [Bryobacteraceae bacterium]|nr:PEP-CTERM sorting domain-containing protein [Bryobacteraceae bacterium]
MRELGFRKHAVVLYAVVILVGMVSAARADTAFTINNTGAPGGAFGTDPNWNYYSTTTDPSVNPGLLPTGTNWSPAYVVDSSAWPLGTGPWTQNTGSGSGRGNWIGPTPAYMSFGGKWYLTAAPSTYFVYQTSFYIPTDADLSRVLISGIVASDNCDTTVGINGTGLGGSVIAMTNSCTTNGNSYSTGHTFEIGGMNAKFGVAGYEAYYSSFQPGWNTIQFVVFNDATSASPNPTGLVVWDLLGTVPEVPEPATAGLMVAGIAAACWLRRRRSPRSV